MHVLITGGSRGIGRAVAEALAGQGAHVVINYLRREAQAREVADGIVALADGGPVLELGVGTGRLALDLFENHLGEAARYRAHELSPKMVALARERLDSGGELRAVAALYRIFQRALGVFQWPS